MDDLLSRSVTGKVAWRLLPFLFLLYMINILDRANVGFASLQMQRDLKMSEEVFALGAGIFYIGYLAFEVPSNFILARMGARRWISRIMISWGLITCVTMAVRTSLEFYFVRILLGIAEAGFFPGIILYLTYWFPSGQRARTVAFFMVASPLTGVLGSPLSGTIMQYMDQAGGLRGWQWVFLLEGIPAVILGVVALYFLTDRPELANWLTSQERDCLVSQVGREELTRRKLHGLTFLKAMADRRPRAPPGQDLSLGGAAPAHLLLAGNSGRPGARRRRVQDRPAGRHPQPLCHGRHDCQRLALRPHRRAPLARGPARISRGLRLGVERLGRFAGIVHLLPGTGPDGHHEHVADVLVVADGIPERHRGGGRDRPDQLRGQPGRICRPQHPRAIHG